MKIRNFHIVHLHDMSPKERGPIISTLDLYVIQSRYLYLKKVMGDVVMKSLLLLHKIKAFIAIGYFVIRRNNEKIENWKKIKKILFSISG